MPKFVLSPTQFRALVSGQRRGMWAAGLRCVLRAVEFPYAWVMRLRNFCYDYRLFRTRRVSVPVVSVGNLTLGGTGKTPAVEWLARWFSSRGARVAVVSRGYGARAGSGNDEAAELAAKLPDVPQVQNPDRVTAAETLDELADFYYLFRVEPDGRLVEDEHFRVAEKRLCQPDTLFVPA